jgi:dipeptidyl aminopeptidase/acylaminoacyl peptidase
MYFGPLCWAMFALLAGSAIFPDGTISRASKRFTVADDVELTHFGDPYTGKAEPVIFSPDGTYFVVDTERGLLKENRPESTLRVFRTEDVHRFLLHMENTPEPSPIWLLSKSTYKNGPIITHIRWLPDSSGVAFLTKTSTGNDQLFLADLKTKGVQVLTPARQHVTAYDIRDSNHFVYTALSPAIQHRADSEAHATSIVGTGRDLYSLIFPNDVHSEMEEFDRSELWAVVDGKRFAVEEKSSGNPLTIYSTGQQALTLAPDGRSAVTAMAFPTISSEWKTLYPRVIASRQDIRAFSGFRFVSRYVLVDLLTTNIKELTHAPIVDDVKVAWSDDGQSIVLSNTFLPDKPSSGERRPSCPCVVVFDLRRNTSTCLLHTKGKRNEGLEQDSYDIRSLRFARSTAGHIIIQYHIFPSRSLREISYMRENDGTWNVTSEENNEETQERVINVSIKEDLNDPPVLVATDAATKSSAIIWDPNPQLKGIDLGTASIYRWKDKSGRELIGGLYKPTNYLSGRYPLVIQTHGFRRNEFRANGPFPSAFAARELASAGIVVLQVNDIGDCTKHIATPEESPCAVAEYEAAIDQLAQEGLVDAHRVGIVGFSRTSFYVMQALTTSRFRFKAASISDGVNAGYFQYLADIDREGNAFAHDAEGLIGSRPVGQGLLQWINNSPEFNLDKVVTPLQVVALNRASVIIVWEPYAGLHNLNKPVDLLILPEGTHVLSNPRDRMLSQGSTVDWFRFWLQDYEDPDPAKGAEYIRWRDARQLQHQNEPQPEESFRPTVR